MGLKVLKIVKRIYEYIFPNKYILRVRPWFKVNGDKTLRLEYPELDNDSIVMDMGGYEGQWTSDIYSKYNSNIYVFEPYIPYAEAIKSRFIKNEKIKVLPFGLGKSNSKELLNVSADGSSVFRGGNSNTSEIEIIEAAKFLKDNSINKIDLIKINIEGGEYDLLENLIKESAIKKFVNIQVQFHDFIPDADIRMKYIQKELSKTHNLTFQYEFVWENWRLKNISQ